NKHNCLWFPTSAKTGENVEKGFIKIARACVDFPSFEKTQGSRVIYKAPEVYTSQAVLDAIIIDFVECYGNEIEGMAIVEKSARDIGINVQHPEKSSIQKLVEILKNIETEKGFSKRDVEENFARRLMMIAYIN
ncbi:MAG: hypothetical protein ACPL1Y_07140, partial [Thermoplasmata archaeon]